MCKIFQNTKQFKYEGVPKEQTEKIKDNMRILETCVLQKLTHFKKMQDVNSPTFNARDLDLYNNIMKTVIVKKRYFLPF